MHLTIVPLCFYEFHFGGAQHFLHFGIHSIIINQLKQKVLRLYFSNGNGSNEQLNMKTFAFRIDKGVNKD